MTFQRVAIGRGAAFALGMTLLASSALAGGFALRDQSATGDGMAYAGMAAGGSLSSMFWNPATLADVDGFVYETDLTAILPYIDVHLSSPAPFAQNQGNIGVASIIPATYAAYRFNQNLIFGLGVNSPFGLATRYDQSTIITRGLGVGIPSAAGGSRISSIDVNPNVAYQFNDQLTVAAGLQVQYLDIRESSFLANSGDYKGKTNDLGVGFTLGADWKPQKGTSVGLGFRSGIRNSIDGTLSGLAPISLDGHLTIKTPSITTFGIAQDIGDRWTVRGGVEYTNWSVLKSIPVTGSASAILASIPMNYRDGWFFSTGAEYKYSPELKLRTGIGWEISPNDETSRTFRLPDSDRLWLSTGLSYAPAKWYSIDAGYSYLHGFGKNILSAIDGGSLTNSAFSGTTNGNIHILSVAWKVKLGS